MKNNSLHILLLIEINGKHYFIDRVIAYEKLLAIIAPIRLTSGEEHDLSRLIPGFLDNLEEYMDARLSLLGKDLF